MIVEKLLIIGSYSVTITLVFGCVIRGGECGFVVVTEAFSLW